MKSFEKKSGYLITHGVQVLNMVYFNIDISVYEYHSKHGLTTYHLINWKNETISPIDYKDLVTIKALLQNCNIEFPKNRDNI